MNLEHANNQVDQTINDDPGFQSINRGYNSVFRWNRLSLGLVAPLEAYTRGPVPSMTRHLERVHLALNLRFNQIDTEETMKRLADDILPDFPGPDIAL